jgi:hypothetical protein
MERTPIFMDWQNEYCENGYTAESNLQIQCNPHQILWSFFTKIEKSIKKKSMSMNKTP